MNANLTLYSAEVGIQNAVLQGASDFINGMMGQIEGALEELQISAGTIAAQLIDATSQLQGFINNLGSQTGGVAGQLIGNIQNVLGNLLGNLCKLNVWTSIDDNEVLEITANFRLNRKYSKFCSPSNFEMVLEQTFSFSNMVLLVMMVKRISVTLL